MSKRVTGLAAAFDGPTVKESTPSAVTSIAARFDQAPQVDAPAISERVSSIAERFGHASNSPKPISPSPVSTPTRKSTPAPVKPTKQTPVKESRSSDNSNAKKTIHEIAGRFADKVEVEKTPSAFSEAALAFRRREQAGAKPTESRVTQYAKQLDQGKTGDRLTPASRGSKEGSGGRSFEGGSVGDVLAKFNSNSSDEKNSVTQSGEKSVKDRFADVSKMFEKGGVIGNNQSEVTEDADAIRSERFKEATRLFSNS